MGLHFFSPANVTKLLEIVRGAKTAKDVLATSLGVAKQIKKIGVVAGVCDGFIGNRMLNAYFRQMELLLELGALPQQIDKALEKFGFAMGPFRVSDLAGNDIGWSIRKRLYVEHPDLARSKIPDRICELGPIRPEDRRRLVRLQARRSRPRSRPRWSRKSFWKNRPRSGMTRRKVGDEEIVERALYSLDQRGRAHTRGGHRAARLGHRRGVHRGIWISGFSRRPDVLRRHRRTAECAARDARIRQGVSAATLGACAAVGKTGLRESNLR